MSDYLDYQTGNFIDFRYSDSLRVEHKYLPKKLSDFD
jgi:hypothetical protein